MPVHLLIILVLLWFIVNFFDEYTSYKSTSIPGLIETDPFARDPKTLKFSLKRGVTGKAITTVGVLAAAYYAPVASTVLLVVLDPMIGFAAAHNFYLYRKYKT